MPYQNPIETVLKNPFRFVGIIKISLLWMKSYFKAQEQADSVGAKVIETLVDDRIPPDERAIYPYLFACLYILYGVWHLMDKLSKEDYLKATEAYMNMIREAERVFLNNPTRMRDRERLHHPLTRFTHTIDGPTNCFPSLHVAFVMLSFQFLKGEKGIDPLRLEAMKHSCIDICRSTMQTKQHSVIDVIGGIALSRSVFLNAHGPSMATQFDDLLNEILPELTTEEKTVARAAIENEAGLIPLMETLLGRFSG
ncbi:hypothetical protein WDW37_11330 [Bdellovibrionota bacterium FG-1]